MQDAERWLPVVGWEGVYEVSDFGNVRRVLQGRGTRGFGKNMKAGAGKGGYLHVNLQFYGRYKIAKVHHLVMSSFVGPRPKNQEVNHMDGNPANNRLDNLEYCSSSENKLHSYAVLKRAPQCSKGAINGRAKLSDEQVRDIRFRYAQGGVSQQKLADEYGVNQTMIGFIVRRVSWSHVS